MKKKISMGIKMMKKNIWSESISCQKKQKKKIVCVPECLCVCFKVCVSFVWKNFKINCEKKEFYKKKKRFSEKYYANLRNFENIIS